MMKKKILSVLMAGLMIFGATACGGGSQPASESKPQAQASEKKEEPKKEETKKEEVKKEAPKAVEGHVVKIEDFKGKKWKFGMITDTGGIHDQSFNQSSWEGLEALQKAYPDNVSVSYLESHTDADYVKNIETMIDQENDIIFGIGFKMEGAFVEAAKNYPDQKFAIVDAVGADKDGKIPANLQGILFRADQASFLVGYIAGKMTKTNKVGHMNGMDTPTMNEFAAGYYAGVWTANPKCEIFGQYANSFSDVAKGHSIADQMYSQGADIIFACGGDTGNGVIDAAKEKDKWVIGVDRDQYSLAPKNMLTSAMKRVGDGIQNLCKDYIEGKGFDGKPVTYGLDSGAVGIAPSTQNLPPELVKEVQDLEQKIIKGEIKVPRTAEELEKMFPNAPSKFMK